MEKATFAAGCFWGVEEKFRCLDGVVETTVGYTGGDYENPTYEDVCSGKTGHAESIEIIYDPAVISYDDLLNVFWNMHNPTTLNVQGPDIGSQYRSAIFFHNQIQESKAKASKEQLQQLKKYKGDIVTEITPARKFYPAEEYHQEYLKKHNRGKC
ncbi:MAG: peptide-methionine (S)-S-oxide reductase [Candidatus Melainabacteria bacterium RIFOXYA12_FULL_32_12]|nr:MAG: peptide-methionine (S)-S-oxide reductase [Candidatus Melainabacteria bacterium RIFOXYA2_FULL_32_9]OGI26892.1 MAG: peptide-methionine (S)-S-oxide reductase [Candidatus Melainabacteria bacterium RIFOXYA12_FULL_32_12]